jgi:hypothetical protein
MDSSELADRFNFHPAGPARRKLHEDIRAACAFLAGFLDAAMADSREKSLALTNLEEVMFWANAGVARGKGNDSPDAPEPTGALKLVTGDEVPIPQYLEDLARGAYQAYGCAVGNVNIAGNPLPRWEDLGSTIQSAWVAASYNVRQSAINTREDDDR